jgi:hypothetical protein
MIVVDRIEGELAVLEIAGVTVELSVDALPAGATEGSVLRLALDPEAQDTLEDENRARLERLKKRDPSRGGVLAL